MDLALPADVPVAELLPTLLRHVGEEPDGGGTAGPWALSRLGGPPLDTGRTPAQLEVRDGELLYLAPRSAAAAEIVFDDVVDAVATATRDRAQRWVTATTRQFATSFAATAFLGGSAVVLFAGPPQQAGSGVGLGVGLLLLVTAAVLSRVTGDSRAGALFGSVALAYGGVGGLLLLAGDRPVGALAAPDVLVAATVVVLFAALATAAVGDYAPLFFAAAAVAVMAGLGAAGGLLFGGLGPAGAAAVLAILALGAVPALPMFSYRLARLPLPTIPTGPDDLRSDVERVEGAQILAQSERAGAYLTALIAAVAVIVAGGAVVLVLDGGWRGLLLAAVLAALLLLRARPFLGRAQRLSLLAGGCVALAAAAAAGFAAADVVARLGLVLGGVVLAAMLSLGYGLGVAGKRLSPVWGRLLDIVDILLIVAVVPLAAWVAGVYDLVATATR
jgi:type VII secretion integral membrane protein EccD